MDTKQLQLVTPKQARRLEELGFNLETDYVYDYYGIPSGNSPHVKCWKDYIDSDWFDPDYIAPAPTVAHALKWMRDEKNIGTQILLENDGMYYATAVEPEDGEIIECNGQKTWEAAESALLDAVLDKLEKEEKQ